MKTWRENCQIDWHSIKSKQLCKRHFTFLFCEIEDCRWILIFGDNWAGYFHLLPLIMLRLAHHLPVILHTQIWEWQPLDLFMSVSERKLIRRFLKLLYSLLHRWLHSLFIWEVMTVTDLHCRALLYLLIFYPSLFKAFFTSSKPRPPQLSESDNDALTKPLLTCGPSTLHPTAQLRPALRGNVVDHNINYLFKIGIRINNYNNKNQCQIQISSEERFACIYPFTAEYTWAWQFRRQCDYNNKKLIKMFFRKNG